MIMWQWMEGFLIRKDICDAKVVRGIFDGSDHLAVLGNLRMKEKWVYEKRWSKREGVNLERSSIR